MKTFTQYLSITTSVFLSLAAPSFVQADNEEIAAIVK